MPSWWPGALKWPGHGLEVSGALSESKTSTQTWGQPPRLAGAPCRPCPELAGSLPLDLCQPRQRVRLPFHRGGLTADTRKGVTCPQSHSPGWPWLRKPCSLCQLPAVCPQECTFHGRPLSQSNLGPTRPGMCDFVLHASCRVNEPVAWGPVPFLPVCSPLAWSQPVSAGTAGLQVFLLSVQVRQSIMG